MHHQLKHLVLRRMELISPPAGAVSPSLGNGDRCAGRLRIQAGAWEHLAPSDAGLAAGLGGLWVPLPLRPALGGDAGAQPCPAVRCH